jgi:hypothetical protein
VIVTEIELEGDTDIVTDGDCELVGEMDDVGDRDGKTELEMDGEDVIEELIELEDDFVGEELGKA